jgi:hypothetical protein
MISDDLGLGKLDQVAVENLGDLECRPFEHLSLLSVDDPIGLRRADFRLAYEMTDEHPLLDP